MNFLIFILLSLPVYVHASPFGNAQRLQGRNIATTAPADTNVLTWNATTSAWAPAAAAAGSGSSTPTASTVSKWDANVNFSADSFISGYATTATNAATTTLTVDSKQYQYFTGSTTQTVVLPVVTTLVNGESFTITNLSSGVVTVQSSGANSIQAMAANTQLVVTVKDTTAGTGTTSWTWVYSSINAALPGGTTYSANQYGVLLSGATNVTSVVLAPDASTTKVLTSGGTGANPTWSAAPYPTLTTLTDGLAFGVHALTTGQLANAGNVALTQGTWMVTGTAMMFNATPQAATLFQCCIATASGNSCAGAAYGIGLAIDVPNDTPANSWTALSTHPQIITVASGTTTYYFNVEIDSPSYTGIQWTGHITALKIAP